MVLRFVNEIFLFFRKMVAFYVLCELFANHIIFSFQVIILKKFI